jgi:hypothetical protein
MPRSSRVNNGWAFLRRPAAQRSGVPLPFVDVTEPFVPRRPPFVVLGVVSIGMRVHPAFT